jgi:hypothetical protein
LSPVTNLCHPSALTASVPPSRLVVSRTRTASVNALLAIPEENCVVYVYA